MNRTLIARTVRLAHVLLPQIPVSSVVGARCTGGSNVCESAIRSLLSGRDNSKLPNRGGPTDYMAKTNRTRTQTARARRNAGRRESGGCVDRSGTHRIEQPSYRVSRIGCRDELRLRGALGRSLTALKSVVKETR